MASNHAVPDLTDRRALVTGGNSGVGLEIARALAGAGAIVVMPVRNRAKGEDAAASVRQTVPDARIELRDLDLACLDTVDDLARALVREGDPIDLYVMNAGIVLLGDQERRTSPSGTELHLATNFVGHYALTTGILPLLSAGGARVVAQCSSIAQLLDIDWNDVQCRRRYSPLRAYASSKVALGLFADELGRRSAAHGWGLTVKVSHPGIAPDTGIAGTVRERLTGSRVHTFVRRISNTPAQAAQPALMAAVADAAGASFFGPSGFLHLGGPAAPQRIYRHLVAPGGGERAWALGARLSGHPVPDADTMP